MISTVLLADTSFRLADSYTPPHAPPLDFQGLFLRLIIWTVFLMGLCLTTWMVVKYRRRPRSLTEENTLRLQMVVPLSRMASLYFVQVEEQTVAVATDSSGLRTMILLSPLFADSLAHATSGRPEDDHSAQPSGVLSSVKITAEPPGTSDP
jgi:hypothetical protein